MRLVLFLVGFLISYSSLCQVKWVLPKEVKKTPYYNKGDSLSRVKNYADAVEYYTRSIYENEDDRDIYYARGVAQFNLDNYYGSVEDLMTYLDKVKGREYDRSMDYRGFTVSQVMVSYFFIGYSYLKRGDRERACLCFSKAGQYGNKDAYVVMKNECK